MVRGEAPDNFRGVASGCPLFRGKNVRESAVGDAKSVPCSEFRGGRFSEVVNVLHKRDFQFVIATVSAVGSVSASRSVRSGRFYCTSFLERVDVLIFKINAPKFGGKYATSTCDCSFPGLSSVR